MIFLYNKFRFNNFQWKFFRRGLFVKTIDRKAIITAVFCLFLATACSKKLIPQESGSVSGGTESLSVLNEQDQAPQDQAPWNPGTNSGSSNPFVSGEQNDSSDTGSGMQESRLQSFQASGDLKDIYFKFDQSGLDDNSKEVLNQNAEFIKNNPNMHIQVQGHCDERGTNNYNIALGERRAHSTKEYLMRQGVDRSKLHVISYGEEKPFCFESNEACWSQNRRAHFMVSK